VFWNYDTYGSLRNRYLLFDADSNTTPGVFVHGGQFPPTGISSYNCGFVTYNPDGIGLIKGYSENPSFMDGETPYIFIRNIGSTLGIDFRAREADRGNYGMAADTEYNYTNFTRFGPDLDLVEEKQFIEMGRELLYIRGASDTALLGQITSGTGELTTAIVFRSLDNGLAGVKIGGSTAWNPIIIFPNGGLTNLTASIIPARSSIYQTCGSGDLSSGDVPCYISWEYGTEQGFQIIGEFPVGSLLYFGIKENVYNDVNSSAQKFQLIRQY